MKLGKLLYVSLVVAVVATAGSAFGQEKKTAKTEGREPQQEAMMVWEKAAIPGPKHEILNYMIGTWDLKVKAWWHGGPEPMEDTATCENKWVLGRRYVHIHVKGGDFEGGSFEGIGYAGYDNIKKKYVSAWMDTMGTMIVIEEGDYDPSTKTFTYYSSHKGPMGNAVKGKSVVKVVGKDKYVITMWHMYGEAKEYAKMMEIIYTRSAASAKADEVKQAVAAKKP